MRVFETHKQLEEALERDPCKSHRAFRFLPEYMPAGFVCSDCKQTVPFKLDGGTGYGTDKQDNMFCYPCGAIRSANDLEREGKGVLYLSGRKVGDWTGELSIPVHRVAKGSHNLAGTRYDVWFRFRGTEWHGVQYGDNTQICHVRRVKS